MDFIAALGREAAALRSAAGAAPKATVPTCPDWDMAELVAHAGMAHRWGANAVRQEGTTRPDFGAPPGDDLLAWFDEGVAELTAALRSTDPATPAWTWDPGDRTVRFWHRRMAHETAVHRVDAELAAGNSVTPVDPALAVDGIDEALRVFLPRVVRAGGDVPAGGETVHLHATDADGEWLVTFDGVPTVTTGHAKGDAAVRGPAGDLYLWLWGRVPLERLEVFGDAAHAERLRRLTTI